MGVETPKKAWTPSTIPDDGLVISARPPERSVVAFPPRPLPKPQGNITDLLKVTTKTAQPGTAVGGPVSAPSGANDLLGSLVRQHLDRAAAASPGKPAERAAPVGETPSPAEFAELDDSLAAAGQAILDSAAHEDSPEEVATVQRDFAKLFDPAESAAKAPREPGRAADREDLSQLRPPPGSDVETGSRKPGALSADDQQASLSSAELEALLMQELSTAGPPGAPAAAPAAAPQVKAMDTDGLLEAELVQLLGEKPAATSEAAEVPAARVSDPFIPTAPAESHATITRGAFIPTQAPADLRIAAVDSAPGASSAASVAEPASAPASAEAAASRVAPAPDAATIAQSVASSTAPVEAAVAAVPTASAAGPVVETSVAASPGTPLPTAPAGMSAPPPVVVEGPDAEEAGEAPAARHSVVKGVALMVAQLVDLPFFWISDADRHLIGLAAFLLLAGGAILWIVHYMIG